MPISALIGGLAGALSSGREAEIVGRVKAVWGSEDVLLTDSGTSALTLAIQISAARSTPMVALPAFACYDLATAADGARANVVLYDVEPDTLAPDPVSFKRALARKPDAVVAVHLYGVPVDTPLLKTTAESIGALLIEDAAQGIGATLRGKTVGSAGSLAVLSFGRGKGMSGGSGGALLANDVRGARVLQRARELLGSRTGGWHDLTRASAQYVLARPALYAVPAALPFLRLGETIYHAPSPPRHISRAATRILAAAWSSSIAATGGRRELARRFTAAAEAARLWETIQVRADAEPGFLRLPLLVRSGTRDVALGGSAAGLGIMPGYPLPLSRLPGFADRVVNRDDLFPGAAKLAANLITLPTHALLSSSDQERIERWLADPAGA